MNLLIFLNFLKSTVLQSTELKILKGVAPPQVIEALNAGDVNSAISLSGCSVTSSPLLI